MLCIRHWRIMTRPSWRRYLGCPVRLGGVGSNNKIVIPAQAGIQRASQTCRWFYCVDIWLMPGGRKSKTAGGRPAASHFLLLRQKKVTQEKATPIRHLFEVPCVARLVRLPHKLARSATRPRAQTYSSEFPDQPALLGGAQGRKSENPKSLTPYGGQQVARHTR